MRARLEPALLDGFAHGQRFALRVLPPEDRAIRGSILCVQPFGDEANLSRRVLVAQALRLAQAGWTTLLADLYGTGDSAGQSDQADLALWRADLLRASLLCREQVDGPFVLWGLRMGTLLASDLALALDQLAAAMVFWQPAATGAQLLDPLLKLSRVGAMMRAGADSTPDTPDMPERAASHATLDLAGYRLRRALIEDLRALALQPPAQGAHSAPCPVLMLGMQRVLPGGGASPKALSDLAGQWLGAGFLARQQVVQAEPFWTSQEPSLPLAAFEATESFLEQLDVGA